jgi:hypothetical protein
MTLKKLLSALVLILFFHSAKSQDWASGLDSLSDDGEKDYAIATFKTTRLIDQHTIETVGPNTLDFRISHRFGPVNSAAYNFWGLDGPANIRLSLEYSPDGRFMFGVGRSSYEKMFDGFLKYKLLRQTTNNSMPLTLTLFAGGYYTSLKDNNAEANGYNKYEYTSSRLSYCFEAMFGRKFTPSFSFQIAPWFVHYNLVDNITDKNDAYGVAALFRLKFSKRSAITGEYAYRINDYSPSVKYYDSMSFGYELETGGHVFQIHFTNSFGLIESQFFPHTDSQWNNMGIRLGFNISRVFTM